MLETLKQQALYIKANQYYASLGSRDQLALKVLVLFLAVIILVAGVLIPSYQYALSAQKEYRQSVDDLTWMQNNQHRVNSKAPANRNGSLLSIVNSTAQSSRIAFKRFEPVGENNLNLWVENVSFNNMIQWVERLSDQYGIQVREIAVDRQISSGTINARIVLEG